MLKRFASNAGANVLSGVVTAVYQLGLTAIATHIWHGTAFSSWALALSIAAIVPLFGSNLSSVVTRRIVQARHGDSPGQESSILAGARRLGRELAALAVALLLLGGAWVHAHTSSVQLDVASFLLLLSLLLATNVWIILWQVRFGLYYANECNWLPALTLTLARALALAGFALALEAGADNLHLAGFGVLAGTWIGLALGRLLLPAPASPASGFVTVEPTFLHREYRRNLVVFSGFAVWSIGALIIQYGIPPLVAVIAPTQFNAFYLASTLNLVAIGAIGAAMSALLAPLSRWHATGAEGQLRRIVLVAPLVCAGCCAAVLAVGWFALGPVLQALGTRTAIADQIRPFAALLGFQTIVRTAAMGYSVSMAAVASVRQMSAPIVLEIALTFLVAAPFGWCFGPIALLAGLVFAGFASSVLTCWIGVNLAPAVVVRRPHALGVFVASQGVACVAWWLIAGRAL